MIFFMHNLTDLASVQGFLKWLNPNWTRGGVFQFGSHGLQACPYTCMHDYLQYA